MTRKSDKPEEAPEVEFVPGESFVKAVEETTAGIPGEGIQEDGQGLPPVLVAPPERYRILQPWLRHTLVDRLNEEAANGWRLAAVVDNTIIILERID